MRFATPLLLLVLAAAPAWAQTTGSCSTGSAQAFLEANQARGHLFNTGNLYFRSTTVGAGYEIPQGEGVQAIFAAGLWVGGFVNDELRVAAARYANTGESYEFWPGPLDENGNPPENCSEYDRIYSVTREDVEAYEGGDTPTDDLAEWPADLGAPFIDADEDGTYDLASGDRPDLKGADQGVFWIMNDVGNAHLSTGTAPIGIEVRVFAYAYDQPGLETSTFYDYEIEYKGSAPLEDTYIAMFVDPDLGCYTNDYIGSDPERDLGYVYNGDEADITCEGVPGYGTAPPALGYDFLRSPTGEDGEPLGMSKFTYFNNVGGPVPQNDPATGQEYYNYMSGFWDDGTPFTFGGDGYNPGSTDTTDYAYPGDPPLYWSEWDIDDNGTSNLLGDRRFVTSSGPFTMEPGAVQRFTVGVLWARGNNLFDSVAELKALSDEVQDFFDNPPPIGTEDGAAQPEAAALAPAYPNPFRTSVTLPFGLDAAGRATVEVYDVLGRRVAVLLDGDVPAGTQQVTWAPEASLPSGVYFVRLTAGDRTTTTSVVLQR